jgi:hypothetical protein
MLKILRATVAAIVAVTLILVTASYAPLALGWAALLSLAWLLGRASDRAFDWLAGLAAGREDN